MLLWMVRCYGGYNATDYDSNTRKIVLREPPMSRRVILVRHGSIDAGQGLNLGLSKEP
jgi:hypothetical protein